VKGRRRGITTGIFFVYKYKSDVGKEKGLPEKKGSKSGGGMDESGKKQKKKKVGAAVSTVA